MQRRQIGLVFFFNIFTTQITLDSSWQRQLNM